MPEHPGTPTSLSIWPPFYQPEPVGCSLVPPVPELMGANMGGLVSVRDVALSGPSVAVLTGTLSSAFFFAVYVEVLEEITGASGFDIGTNGATDMFAKDVGTGVGVRQWARSYSPVEFFWGDDIPLLLSAKGEDFTGGKVRIATYALGLTAPTSS